MSLKWIVGHLVLYPQIARGTTLAFFEKYCLIIIPATGDDGGDLVERIIGINAVLELSTAKKNAEKTSCEESYSNISGVLMIPIESGGESCVVKRIKSESYFFDKNQGFASERLSPSDDQWGKGSHD